MTKRSDDQSNPAAHRRKKADDEVDGCSLLIAVGILLTIIIFGLYQCSRPTELTEQERLDQAVAEDAEIMNRIKGLHCLSRWDGSNVSLVSFVKSGLRDPDSFEHVDTLITPKSDETGMHGITMSYRARNGIGGMNLSRAIGEVDPNTCETKNIVVSD